MTGPEVTAAMKAEDVDPALVEKAARAIHAWNCCPMDKDSQCYGEHLYAEEVQARHALAAVLPDARYAAKVEAITEARKVISQYLATAEKWRYDRVMWAFAIMLGEIPEDTPCPDSPADARERAARLTATTEVRCNCGFGGFHDDGNPRCDQNATMTEEPTT